MIYVICNNDAMLSATHDEETAISEVARLKASQTDDRYYYHYHGVLMLEDHTEKPRCSHANHSTEWVGSEFTVTFCKDCGESLS